jgi:hypothetical protein
MGAARTLLLCVLFLVQKFWHQTAANNPYQAALPLNPDGYFHQSLKPRTPTRHSELAPMEIYGQNAIQNLSTIVKWTKQECWVGEV